MKRVVVERCRVVYMTGRALCVELSPFDYDCIP